LACNRSPRIIIILKNFLKNDYHHYQYQKKKNSKV